MIETDTYGAAGLGYVIEIDIYEAAGLGYVIEIDTWRPLPARLCGRWRR
ncbi:hypothetical protein [Alicyclobacillus sp. ALC3]|nr:hypothetical protein [Alicyclobacillus sp. ALC3]WDL95189.1 hypothetical protein JC200_12215 [Alicyclobacillus sp. ALC3]